MCRFFVGNRHFSQKKKYTLRSESQPTAPTICVSFFGETRLMRRFKTLASAYKCPEMP